MLTKIKFGFGALTVMMLVGCGAGQVDNNNDLTADQDADSAKEDSAWEAVVKLVKRNKAVSLTTAATPHQYHRLAVERRPFGTDSGKRGQRVLAGEIAS